jgi:hypothetical protein
MCSKRSCSNCGKASWVGCGLHIETALDGVPIDERCPNWKKGYNRPCKTNDDGTYSCTTNETKKGGIMNIFGLIKSSL